MTSSRSDRPYGSFPGPGKPVSEPETPPPPARPRLRTRIWGRVAAPLALAALLAFSWVLVDAVQTGGNRVLQGVQEQPTPTPTPRLARSITQVLVTFCEAINHQDYQTAWNEYARSLQHKHPRPDVVTAWRRFIRCSIPDQSADPSALDTLTLTLGSGYTDRFGRSGDINYRFTMGIEQQAWRITGVCEIYSEGCFDITWG